MTQLCGQCKHEITYHFHSSIDMPSASQIIPSPGNVYPCEHRSYDDVDLPCNCDILVLGDIAVSALALQPRLLEANHVDTRYVTQVEAGVAKPRSLEEIALKLAIKFWRAENRQVSPIQQTAVVIDTAKVFYDFLKERASANL